jgi:hypothetical protein
LNRIEPHLQDWPVGRHAIEKSIPNGLDHTLKSLSGYLNCDQFTFEQHPSILDKSENTASFQTEKSAAANAFWGDLQSPKYNYTQDSGITSGTEAKHLANNSARIFFDADLRYLSFMALIFPIVNIIIYKRIKNSNLVNHADY